jgi:hypothetical protein
MEACARRSNHESADVTIVPGSSSTAKHSAAWRLWRLAWERRPKKNSKMLQNTSISTKNSDK